MLSCLWISAQFPPQLPISDLTKKSFVSASYLPWRSNGTCTSKVLLLGLLNE